ncbi:MAG TPA: histidine kinase [Bryobacteraceae bacterium]|nr:histidine kinase [Bryobacteraceae bacterium]
MPASALWTAKDYYLAIDAVGFVAGFAIAVLLLVLTLRVARHARSLIYVLLAFCALLWTGGGLALTIALAYGYDKTQQPALIAAAVQFTGAAMWPVPFLALWSRAASPVRQIVPSRILFSLAALNSVVLTIALWAAVLSNNQLIAFARLKEWVTYTGLAFLAGSGVLVKHGVRVRSVRLSYFSVLGGVAVAALSLLLHSIGQARPEFGATLLLICKHSVLLIVLGAFFLVSSFRFADLFFRYTIRILLASLTALTALLVIGDKSYLAQQPVVTHLLLGAVMLTFVLTLFSWIDQRLGGFVERWIFQAPDYRSTLQVLGGELQRLQTEEEIIDKLERHVQETLELASVKAVPVKWLPNAEWVHRLDQGDVLEAPACRVPPVHWMIGVEMLLPVRLAGSTEFAVAVIPGGERRSLVTHEVAFLKNVVGLLGARLEALRWERDRLEQQSREMLLQQQITEAEVRALRAQVSPHFLFNSLNTIADLIVVDPPRAETMTLRLARVFRHVLAQSTRPVTSVREEIDFVRTYLEIEEARFGDRLKVRIDVADEVAYEHIPSLILQPVVENALKHGLAPKPGQGNLWITAGPFGPHLRLQVEDDGLGPRFNGRHPFSLRSYKNRSGGVGLANVKRRLETLYQDQASVTLESRSAGGASVTILIPRSAVVAV